MSVILDAGKVKTALYGRSIGTNLLIFLTTETVMHYNGLNAEKKKV
jgi:hypothetical protein